MLVIAGLVPAIPRWRAKDKRRFFGATRMPGRDNDEFSLQPHLSS